MNLPDDLAVFLKASKQLEYDCSSCEAGKIILCSYDELKTDMIRVNSDESPLKDEDPHAEEDGYYEIPAVSLSKECDGYDPEFILLWLPEDNLFGSWDCDHWDLYVFADTDWADIVADPLPYLNAQWSGNQEVGKYFKPYPKYPFKIWD